MAAAFNAKISFCGRCTWLQAWKLKGKCSFAYSQLRVGISSRSFGDFSKKNDIDDCSENQNKIRNQRLLKVAIIGEPNSGKSTLINSLVGEKVFAVTNRPHTTRQGSQAAFSIGSAQVVLIDTPGLVTHSEGRRLKMSREHITAPEYALQLADVICVVSDSSDKRIRNRLHAVVIEALDRHRDIPSLLILNKIDRLTHKTNLLGLAAILSEDRLKDSWGYQQTGGWGNFERTFMVSAKEGDGTEDIKKYLALKAKPGEWMIPPDSICDLSLEQRIAEVFREKLLEIYEHEIPFQIKQVNVICEMRPQEILRVHQKLYCRKNSQRRCVIEKFGILKDEVSSELKEIFGCELDLTIDVGVSEKLGRQTPLPSY